MRNPRTIAYTCFAAILLVLAGRGALAQDAGASITKTGSISEDLYLAGQRVEVRADVNGDVVAAAGTVTIAQRVDGDVLAAGGTVDVTGEVTDDVRVAGATVILDAKIGDDAIAAGGSVTVGADATVGGRAWFAGRKVTVGGRIAKELRAAGETIVISGEVLGDVRLMAQHVEILPTARIRGDLTYHSPNEARIAGDAQIAGNVRHHPLERPHGWERAPAHGLQVGVLASLMLTGIVLFLLWPGFSVAAARAVAVDPWKCLGLGLAVLATTPLITVLLIATLVGAPLALMLLALFAVTLLAGFLVGIIYIGEVGFGWAGKGPEMTPPWRALSIVAALIAFGVVRLVPVLGAVACLLVLLFGVGALTLSTYRVYAASPVRPRPKPRRAARRRS